MQNANEQNPAVRAKAVLIDPASMTAVWMNEAAAQDLSDADRESVPGLPIDQAVPLAQILGVPEALRAAADTGAAQSLQASLVSTAQGSVAIVASVYCLPDGNLLLLMEHAWRAKHANKSPDSSRGSRRRAR